MFYPSLKLYVPVKDLVIPKTLPSNKKICFAFIGENTTFLEAFPKLGLNPAITKYVFVPIISKSGVFSRLTGDLRRKYRSFKLIPVTGFFGDYVKVAGQNFFLDLSNYLEAVLKRFKITNYRVPLAYKKISDLLYTITSVPSDSWERTLLYVVDLTKPLKPLIQDRRFFVLWKMLSQALKTGDLNSLPFDKLLMAVITPNGTTYFLLFDKNKPFANNLSRVRSLLLRLRMIDEEEEKEEVAKQVADETVKGLEKVASGEQIEKTKQVVANAIKNNSLGVLNIISSLSTKGKESIPSLSMITGTGFKPLFTDVKFSKKEKTPVSVLALKKKPLKLSLNPEGKGLTLRELLSRLLPF